MPAVLANRRDAVAPACCRARCRLRRARRASAATATTLNELHAMHIFKQKGQQQVFKSKDLGKMLQMKKLWTLDGNSTASTCSSTRTSAASSSWRRATCTWAKGGGWAPRA